ncbi:MAG: hydroxymethylpyrimidine/phosphomethylpyrimidine kinase [Acidiferrobacterales bacterium]
MSDDTGPVVLLFTGSDPTGGAGIQADIEAIISMGCHPAPVITAVTAQDTTGLKDYALVETQLVIAQARAVLEDIPVAAIKTGMLGNCANLSAVASILADYPDIPVVLDPVQSTGARAALADESLDDALRALLVPRATLMTPNSDEARRLAPDADTTDACAQELMWLGCKYVLITGTHARTPQVINHLYGNMRKLKSFECERLPHVYHGSGCTLASACAAALAHGLEPVNAVARALEYTWDSLKHAHRLGLGQHIPDRLYWARHRTTPDGD